MMLLSSIWLFSNATNILETNKSFIFLLSVLVISIIDVALYLLLEKDIGKDE